MWSTATSYSGVPTVDELEPCWTFGYDGASFGYGEWVEHYEDFHPGEDLAAGDRVGFLILKNNCCVLYVNGVAVLRRKFWDDLDPDKYNYFPVVDLLGSCLEV